MASTPCKSLKRDATPLPRQLATTSSPATVSPTPLPPVARRHPSAIMRPKLFHPISRELSSISRPSLGYVDTSKKLDKEATSTGCLRQESDCDSPGAHARSPRSALAPLIIPITLICMNHSSDKCQPALVHALIPVNPFIRRARPVPGPRRDARGLRQPPVCRHAPKTFITQSLVNSRLTLVHLSVTVDTSKNWTKRRLLQVACGKNPTAIRPVLVHEAEPRSASAPLIIPIT